MPRSKKRTRRKAVFEAKCPLGYTIRLDEKCWSGHILKYHPVDMVAKEEHVRATIATPIEIRKIRTKHTTNLNYYKRFADIQPNDYLKVATRVEHAIGKISFVVTAHPIANIQGGEKIWPK